MVSKERGYVEMKGLGTCGTSEKETKDHSPPPPPSLLNRITFGYLNPLLKTGYTRPVTFEDLPQLMSSERARHTGEKLQALWDQEVKACARINKEPSLFRVLVRAHGREFAVGNMFKLPQDLLLFAGPFLLERLVRFVDPSLTPEEELKASDGFIVVLALFGCQLTQSVFLHQYFNKVFHVAMQARTGLMCLVYTKALDLSHAARMEEGASTGSIVNMMQVDVQKFLDFIPFCTNLLWSSPLQVFVCLALLWKYVGVASLAGFATILFIMPINMWAMKELEKVQKSNMQFKDVRVNAVSELLSGIRVLKYFSWERPAMEKVMQGVLWHSTTAFVALAIFGTYTYLGNRLSLDVAMPVLSLITILQFPLEVLPWMFISSISFRIALARLQKFLMFPSLVDARTFLPASENSQDSNALGVHFNEVHLEWTAGKAVLKDISLQVPIGSLVALVGPVGSGKSTLLSALLGELEMKSGSVSIVSGGPIGYVPQEPWIINATVRENILLGSDLDAARYEEALHVACLEHDITILPAGDMTEIGERGINLSGGQKQRVSIARAVYLAGGLFVLDDPLSAVDSHVAEHIFRKCILGVMSKRTCVLVTHRLNLLKNVPHIVVLDEHQILAQGSYAELLAKGIDMCIENERQSCEEGEPPAGSAIAESAGGPSLDAAADAAPRTPHAAHAFARRRSSVQSAHKDGDVEEEAVQKQQQHAPGQQLIKDEEREAGTVKPQTYSAYFESVGLEMLIAIAVLGIVSQVARVLIGWWVSVWAAAADDFDVAPAHTERRSEGHLALDVHSLSPLALGVLSLSPLSVALRTLEASRERLRNVLGGGLASFHPYTPAAAGTLVEGSPAAARGGVHAPPRFGGYPPPPPAAATPVDSSAEVGGREKKDGLGFVSPPAPPTARSTVLNKRKLLGTPSRPNVPAPWEIWWSEREQAFYCWNPLTRISTWICPPPPPEVPSPWTVWWSEGAQEYYCWNPQTRVSTWDCPVPAIPAIPATPAPAPAMPAKLPVTTPAVLPPRDVTPPLAPSQPAPHPPPLPASTAALDEDAGSASGKDGDKEGEGGKIDSLVNQLHYLRIYFLIALVEALMTMGRDAVISIGSLRAATRLHNRMLEAIIKCPMHFFDSTPLGRVLNRFSKDQDTADGSLPQSFKQLFSCMLATLGPVVLMVSVTPLSLLGVVPVMYLYYSIFQYFRRTSREIKRLEANYRSVIYAHFTESLNGVACLRAFKLVQQFQASSQERIDNLNRVFWPMICCNRWLGLRLELCGNLLVSCSALAAVQARVNGSLEHEDAALIVLSVTLALGITNDLGWMVRQTTEAEANMNSIERIDAYAKLEPEAPSEVPLYDEAAGKSWPIHGQIVFEDVYMRYRESTPFVLRGLSMTITAGEKVGICGRTGAGKSSLLQVLFRLVEAHSGCIRIDGVDIQQLGLHTLRSRLSIVPQDPVLFSGTVRYNMDPFNQYSDKQIWSALETVSMRSKISSLDHKVQEGGANMSLGERQLMCMGRALLREAKILVLDEATAAIDMLTDEVIQKALRSKCKGRTVLTIAHRLNTILDYDKVCVLADGQVLEYDSPQTLMADNKSEFAALLHAHHASQHQ